MDLLTIQGVPLLLGDNISGDVILQGRYSLLKEPEEMAKHVFEDLGFEISQKVQNCPIIVVGKNFGCGSTRESCIVALKAAGVKVILAGSFNRTFFRNSINNGIAAVEWNPPNDLSSLREPIEVSVTEGTVKVAGQLSQFKKLPKRLMDILNAGGLIEYARKELREI